MSFFETKKPEYKPLPSVSYAEWASVYIKWDDDRGRGFDEVSNFKNSDGWIEFDYRHPEAGKAHIRINEYGIRWIEFFETKVEDDQE